MDGGTFDDVVEQEPAVAGELFGDRLDLARQFVRALVEHGEERGLIGPQEVPGSGPAMCSTAQSLLRCSPPVAASATWDQGPVCPVWFWRSRALMSRGS